MRLRFMARHIICVSSSPEAPTMPPTATRKMSLMAMPAMAPATPESELSSEMVIGMSAPPTLREKKRPNSVALSTQSTMGRVIWPSSHHVPSPMAATVSTSHTTVSTEWEGSTTGRWLSTRCSLPAATRLPTRVMVPTAMASIAVKRTNRA